MEAFEWVLVGFTGLTTVLIAWQIFTVIGINRIIKKKVDKAKKEMAAESKKAVGDCTGTIFLHFALLLKDTDSGGALEFLILAVHHLKESGCDGYKVDAALDQIENVLETLKKEKGAKPRPGHAVADLGRLYRINERSKTLACAYAGVFGLESVLSSLESGSLGSSD